jgi:hypothetical protein
VLDDLDHSEPEENVDTVTAGIRVAVLAPAAERGLQPAVVKRP